MNRLPPNGNSPPPLYTALRLPDFDVTWAGPHQFLQGFSFGSEDGRLLRTDEAGRVTDEPARATVSRDAINGVARSGEWIAVSTRQDVTMGSLDPATAQKYPIVAVPHGAHGITTAPSGYFVAPLGRTGIMMLQPGSTPSDPVGLLTSDRPGLYFYRVLALQGDGGKDLLISACRLGGLGITGMRWGQKMYNMRIATFPGLDVIDVCAIGSDPRSPAVAALGRDGTLILTRNALHDQSPVTMKFETLKGTAYRLLCRGEHLFVLTSRGLYGLMKLAGRLVAGMPQEGFETQILVAPMEALDANLVRDRWLLVITPDEVRKFDMDLIERSDPEELIREPLRGVLSPDWKIYEVSQTSKELLPAG